MENIINHFTGTLKSGERDECQFKIGVEIEHFIVDKSTWNSINFYQENGIEAILKKLMPFDYKAKYEKDRLVGLDREDAIITTEPGGQLEISIKACRSIREIEGIYDNFLREIVPILEEQNQYLLTLGYHPKSKIDEIPLIPKRKYQMMEAYLKEKGRYAQNMMKGTAALQVSIDYRDEEDFSRKMKVANFISPLLAIVSDNTPIFEGEVYPQHSARSLIWQHTEYARCGTIPGIMDKPFGYDDYTAYILNMEPILLVKDHQMISTGRMKCAEVLDQAAFNAEELMHFFGMVFPVARAKNYIEIRPGDSLPYPFNFAYIALIKGLFYHQAALDDLFSMAGETDGKMLELYRAEMMEKGLQGEFAGKTIGEFLTQLFAMARSGLPAEEKHYLLPLEEIIRSRKNMAQLAKEKMIQDGLEGLRGWTLNERILEENFYVDKVAF